MLLARVTCNFNVTLFR